MITQVNHQRRCAPLLVKMREECLRRGVITHAVCEFYKCEPEPRYHSRDHMMDDCTHSIDTVRWMCGGEVTGVDSRCRRIGTPGHQLDQRHAALRQRLHRIRDQQLDQRAARVPRADACPVGVVDAELEGMARLYADGDYEGDTYDTHYPRSSTRSRAAAT